MTLTLYRISAKSGSTAETYTATVSWNGNSYSYSNLPAYDAEGYAYTYYVEETPISGFATTYENTAPNDSVTDKAYTGGKIKNTRTDTTGLSGTKVWEDGGASHTNSSEVVLKLYQKSADPTVTTATELTTLPSGATLTWDTTDPSKYTYSNLPKYDAKGYEYTYWVTETQVAEYDAPVYGNTDTSVTDKALDGGTITNKRVEGSLKLKKTVTVNGNSTVTTLVDGTYSFVVQSCTGVTPATTKNVKITITNGVVASATIDGVKATPDADGYVTVSGLPTGDYTVTEDESELAAKGITLTEKPESDKKFKVVKDGTGVVIPTVAFTNNKTEIKVQKTDVVSGAELSGAHIQILDKNGKVVDEWDSVAGTPHVVTGLIPGEEYTLKETVAPDGYTLTVDTTFVIDKEGKVTSGDTKVRDADSVLLVEDSLAPTFEKKIKDTNDSDGKTSDWQDSADYDIGDPVPYRLTAKLAANVADYVVYHITFHDKMEKGLTFSQISRVTVGSKVLAAGEYELVKVSDQEFDLTITWGKSTNTSRIGDKSLNGAVVEVLFDAILNENAVLGKPGNVNTASLEYSCNPKVDQNGKPSEETKKTPDDSVIAFTYKVEINKVDEDGKALSGAEFELKKILADKSEKTVACVTTGSGTVFTFTGLDDGVYKLTETKAPEGYDPIDPIEFTVTADHKVLWDWDKTDKSRLSVLESLTGKATTGELTLTKTSDDLEGLTGDVENTRKLAALTVKKTWSGDDIGDKAKDALSITITGKDIGGAGKDTLTITYADFDKTSKSYTVYNLPVGESYSVTETNADSLHADYTLVTADSVTATANPVVLDADGEEVQLTNKYERNTGSLKIKKTVTLGGKETDTTFVDGKYSFIIQSGTGVAPVTVKAVEIEIKNGQVFAVTGDGVLSGEYALVSGLPTGEYTVTEETSELAEKYITLAKEENTKVTVVKDMPGANVPTASFTNDRAVGDLEVKKTVESHTASDKTLAFQFTVTLSDTSLTGTYGEMSFTKGVATFDLKDGETKTATGLPQGIDYTVAEKAVYGFVNTYSSGDFGSITATKSTAAFTNTRDEGGLTVSKTVESDLANDVNREFQFKVELSDKTIQGTYGDMQFNGGVATFALKDGQQKTALNLPQGVTYMVTETADDGFVTTASGATGMIGKTLSLAAFTNTRKTGDLKVTKSVVSSTASDKEKNFSFTVTLGDVTISGTYGEMTFAKGVASFDLKDGETKTATGLPVGVNYSVQEENYADEFIVDRNGQDGTIAEGAAVCQYMNTRREGELTVEKKLDGEEGDPDRAFEIKVTLDAALSGTYGDMTFTDGVAVLSLKGGEKKTAKGLPANTGYTVEETKELLYELVSSDNLNGTIAENSNKTAHLVNKYRKPEKPGFEKKIQDTNDSTGEKSGWQDSADYDIGDSVPYKLMAVLAKDVTSYWQYHITFHDKMEKGLTFEKIDSVTVNGKALKNDEYELTKIDDQTFDLTVTWGDGKSQITDAALNSATVEVLYTAILNENAVLGEKGNVNSAYLEYSCNPDVDQEGKPKTDTEKTGEDFVITFTYEVDVNKVDQAGEALSGAQFKLEKKLANGSLKLLDCVTAGSGTMFTFTGLDDGEYLLTEISGPKGYKAIDPISFTVSAEHGVLWTELSKRADVLTKLTGDKITGDLQMTADDDKAILTGDVVNEMTTTLAAVKKVWKDDENRDGKRPATLTVNLLANDVKVGSVELKASNGWTAMVKDLPTVDKDGKDIDYTWSEEVPEGYTLESTAKNGILTTLTNTYGPEEMEVSVKKVWNDGNNSKRPTEVKVQLYADGLAVGGTVALNAGNGWSYTWKELPKNAEGKAIAYTVDEIGVPDGYRMTISGNAEAGYVITNTMERGKLVITKWFEIEEKPEEPESEPMLIDIPVVKIWSDNNNKDGNRPASITVHLLAGGEVIDTVQLSEANGWQHTFTNLPETKDKHTIRYSVQEDPVEMYVTRISGYTITNIYQPNTTSATVRKIWDDDNNKAGMRPVSIRMTLSNGQSVLLTEKNGWQATITNLPTIVNGKPAVYTWTEQEVLGYEQTNKETHGTVTEFTNRAFKLPDTPEGEKPPKRPGNNWEDLGEYDTALGLEVIINHVGDCFD